MKMAIKKSAKQLRQQVKDRRATRKAEKVTVRDLIELLAKSDWDSEVTCVNEHFSKLFHKPHTRKCLQHKIVSISQYSQYGTEIVFADN